MEETEGNGIGNGIEVWAVAFAERGGVFAREYPAASVTLRCSSALG